MHDPTRTTTTIGYIQQVTTMQGQVAKIVIVMEYYLAARGDLTLYFGLITRNNYHNITLGKKRHHHSKPTDQKYSTLVNEVFDTWIWIHISHGFYYVGGSKKVGIIFSNNSILASIQTSNLLICNSINLF